MVDRLLQSLGTKSKYYLFLLILTSLLCKIRVSPNPNSFFLNALFIALLLMNYLDQLLLLTVWTSNVARRKSYGDVPPSLFLAKSLVIPAIYTKFKLKFVCEKIEF